MPADAAGAELSEDEQHGPFGIPGRLAERPERPRLPFVAHQVIEYGVGFFMLSSTPQLTPRGGELVLGGALALLCLAAVSDGLLGLGWVSRPLHAALDWLVLVVLACSPFLLHRTNDLAATMIVEGAVVVMLCVTPVTRYTRPVRVRRAPAARPPAAGPRLARRPERVRAVPPARALGRLAGRAGRDGPRSLGRAVGRAQRAARSPEKR